MVISNEESVAKVSIKTSYWGAKPRGNVVAICQTVPRGWDGKRVRELTPTYDLRDPNWRELYAQQLERIPDIFWANLAKILGPDPILMCWEKDPNECHRQILAEFLAEMGFNVVREEPLEASTQASSF